MYAIEIEGMCSGKNMPCFTSYYEADNCFRDAVDFCVTFRHETVVNFLDLSSGSVLYSVAVNPNELPF